MFREIWNYGHNKTYFQRKSGSQKILCRECKTGNNTTVIIATKGYKQCKQMIQLDIMKHVWFLVWQNKMKVTI